MNQGTDVLVSCFFLLWWAKSENSNLVDSSDRVSRDLSVGFAALGGRSTPINLSKNEERRVPKTAYLARSGTYAKYMIGLPFPV